MPRKTTPRRSLLATTAATTAREPQKRTTVSLPAELVDRLRDAAHVEGFGVAKRVGELIRAEVDRLEELRGEPYPRRPGRR